MSSCNRALRPRLSRAPAMRRVVTSRDDGGELDEHSSKFQSSGISQQVVINLFVSLQSSGQIMMLMLLAWLIVSDHNSSSFLGNLAMLVYGGVFPVLCHELLPLH